MEIALAVLLTLFLPAAAAEAGGLKVDRKVREYRVSATLARYPLFLGKNRIEIEIRGGTGENITDAEVLVNYYMPPMPRMVPMNYKTQTSRNHGKYTADMNIIMEGPWYIKIIIRHGGRISTVKLNADAQ